MDLGRYRIYYYFEGEDGSEMEICYDGYGDFEMAINGHERTFK